MGVMEFLKTSACDPPFSHIWLTPPQLGSKHPNTGVGVICCIRCWDSALKLLMTWFRFLHIKSFCFSSLSFVSAYELLYIGLLHVRKFHLFTVEMQLLLTWAHNPCIFTRNKFSETPFIFRKYINESKKNFLLWYNNIYCSEDLLTVQIGCLNLHLHLKTSSLKLRLLKTISMSVLDTTLLL